MSAAPGGRLLLGEPMRGHTSWRVGGPADRFYVPDDTPGLARFLQQQPEREALLWVGLGSNLLVRDRGFRGTVILASGMRGRVERVGQYLLRVDAGVACAKVARFGAEHGLKGAEFLAGIPGTMGGALAMNAGAFGAQTWGIVRGVATLDRRGRHRSRDRSEFDVAYRSVRMPAEEWFISAELELAEDPDRTGSRTIKELLRERAGKQPTSVFSCGSVFKNPPADYAGRLIDRCGLKQARIGGAYVSPKHANFIVNDGGATAADIEALINLVQRTVEDKLGVRLEPEVRIVGEAA